MDIGRWMRINCAHLSHLEFQMIFSYSMWIWKLVCCISLFAYIKAAVFSFSFSFCQPSTCTKTFPLLLSIHYPVVVSRYEWNEKHTKCRMRCVECTSNPFHTRTRLQQRLYSCVICEVQHWTSFGKNVPLRINLAVWCDTYCQFECDIEQMDPNKHSGAFHPFPRSDIADSRQASN